MWVNKNVAYLDNIVENQEILTQDVELIDKYRKVRVYPFRIVSGTQLLTKAGEVDILTNINKEGQYANFYTGNDQITIVWEGSTNLSANNHNSTNNIKETLQVGRYIDLWASDEGLLNKANNISSVNLYGIDYTTTETQNAITLFCDCNEEDINNLQWSFIEINDLDQFIAQSYVPTDYDIQNYVYLILDPRYQSYQWLRIKNVVYSYNNATRKPISALIEFETINNDFTNTGKSILQYFQHGTPNSSYAFPKETYDENGNVITELDIKHIRTQDNDFEGVDSIQLDHLGGYALSSIGLLGRPIDENNYFTQTSNGYERNIRAPQLLLLYDSLRIVESPFINRIPVQNVYAAYNMVNDVQGVWESYKNAFGASSGAFSIFGGYNVTATKQVITGMRPSDSNWDTIKNSNPINNNHFTFNTWLTTGMNTPNWISVLDQSKYVFGVAGFDASTPTSLNVSVSQFLNINHIINWSVDELTTQYTESTKYKLSEVLGVFGNLFTTITGGLDIGWITQKTLATGQTYNVLLPTQIVSSAEAITPLKSENKTYPLSLDAFNDQLASKMLPIDSNLYVAYRFSLTNLFSTSQYSDSDINWIDENNKSLNYGMGYNGIWDTRYIGQTTDENGRLLLKEQNGKTRALNIDIYKMVPQKSDNKFILDWINIKGVGICDRRVAMFRNDIPVYQLIAETKSKVKNNITLWADSWKFNYYDEFNTFGKVQWPVTPQVTPPPTTNTEDNRVIELDKSILYEKQTYQNGKKLNCKNNFQNAYGNNALLWGKNDTLSTALNREKSFQNLSRISNLQYIIKNNVTDLNSTNTQKLELTIDYDLNDISATYENGQWTQNNTFNNLINLQSLTFNTGLNITPESEDGLSYIIPITLERNATSSGELDNLINGSTITKSNNTKTFTINYNDLPQSLLYPLTIGGDFLMSSMNSYSEGAYDSSQRPPKRYTKYISYWEKARWNWLLSPKTLFSNSKYTQLINGQDALSNFSNVNTNLVDSNSQSWFINNRRSVTSDGIAYWNKFTHTANNQTRTSTNNQAFNYVASDNVKVFQNTKPVITPNQPTITLTYDLKIRLNNINQQLIVQYSNIHISIALSGTYTLTNARDMFNARVDIVTNQNSSGGNYPVNPKILSISKSSGYNSLSNKTDYSTHTSYVGTNNFGIAYYTSTWNGQNYLTQTQTYTIQNKPNSALSPMFIFDNQAAKNWSSWLNNSALNIGNWNSVDHWVQQMNNNLAFSSARGLVRSENGKNIIETLAPMSLAWFKTTQIDWTTTTQSNPSGSPSTLPTPTLSYCFQYDNTINFQPLLALDLETTWKN